MKIVDFSNSQIANLIIHEVGNKSKDENIVLSSNKIQLNNEVTSEYLMRYFISSFKFNDSYSFNHEANIQLNEIYNYVSHIFEDKNAFIAQSINIAKHLYEISTHPNIKKGELYIAHLTGAYFDNKCVEAVGIFKCENKDVYLNVDNKNGEYNVYCQKGVNVEKLDKGCIIFNTNVNDGYRLFIVDSNGVESKYWKETFLNVKETRNEYANTRGVLEICKSFVKEIEGMDSTEKITFLNNSLSYFQNHNQFDLNEFSNEIIQKPIINEKFTQFIAEKYEDTYNNIHENFDISPKAVAAIKGSLKNYIKLDTNIEIRIDAKVKNVDQVVEKGYDAGKNLNYYKIYYKDEE